MSFPRMSSEKEPVCIDEEFSEEWSDANDSNSNEEEEFKLALDPGKIDQGIKDKLESVISQKFKIPVNNNSYKRDEWKAWNQDDGNTWGNDEHFCGVPPPPPPPPPMNTSRKQGSDPVDFNGIMNMAMPFLSDFVKNIATSSKPASSESDYGEVVKTLEYACFSGGNLTDERFRAYCFAEKMYSCCRQLLSRAKEAHGEKSYVSAKVESLEQHFKTEFSNLLEQVNPENFVDEVD